MKRKLAAFFVSAGIGLACFLIKKYSFLFTTDMDPELDLEKVGVQWAEASLVIDPPKEEEGMWYQITIIGTKKGQKGAAKWFHSGLDESARIPVAQYRTRRDAEQAAIGYVKRYCKEYNLEIPVQYVVTPTIAPASKAQDKINGDLYDHIYGFMKDRVIPFMESPYWEKAVLNSPDPLKRRTLGYSIFCNLLEKESAAYSDFLKGNSYSEPTLEAARQYCFGQLYVADESDAKSAQ